MSDTWTTTASTGADALAALTDLSWYVDRHSTAFCTSAAWLTAAARHLAGTPVVLVVRAGGVPVGLAALSVTSRRGARRVELLGGDLNDYGQLFHDDARAADALADALTAWLGGLGRWSLRCDQLAADDPVLAGLVARLRGATVETGPPMPQVRGLGTDFTISRNRRRQVAKALNRVTADGHRCEQVVVADGAALEAWLPAVVALRRRRDHAAGRRSHLDDAAVLAFYENVVRDFVSRGRAAIYLLAVDGEVAGYALAMFDGDTHRLVDGRVADELQRYRGGMVAGLMALTRAVEQPGVTTFDWLRGRTEAKLGNHEEHRVGLRAASGRLVTAVEDWEVAARRGLRAALPAAAVRQLVGR